MPFNNRFAVVQLQANTYENCSPPIWAGGGAIHSWAGVTAVAVCKDFQLKVDITVKNKPLDDAKTYKLG